jgi:hypothetical protein
MKSLIYYLGIISTLILTGCIGNQNDYTDIEKADYKITWDASTYNGRASMVCFGYYISTHIKVENYSEDYLIFYPSGNTARLNTSTGRILKPDSLRENEIIIVKPKSQDWISFNFEYNEFEEKVKVESLMKDATLSYTIADSIAQRLIMNKDKGRISGHLDSVHIDRELYIKGNKKVISHFLIDNKNHKIEAPEYRK